MRCHRALRKARRAAGVEDRREVSRHLIVDDQRIGLRQRLPGPEHVAGAAVRHDVVDLGFLEAGVDRNRHDARELRPPERQHPVDAVGKQDRGAIASLEAGRPQSPGDARGSIPHLRECQSLATDLDDRRRVGIAFNASPQHVDERCRPAAVSRDAVASALYAPRVERVAPADGRGHGRLCLPFAHPGIPRGAAGSAAVL